MKLGAACLASLALLALYVGCGDDQTAVGGAGGGGAGGAPSLDFEAGGDRPVLVQVPPDYDDATPAPLVILLHGYGAGGGLEDVYLELSSAALERGAVFAAPDGTRDSLNRPFWNATDTCCNFDDVDVDDNAYLMGLVDEISSALSIDPQRVYFVGHSNGGFMAHQIACRNADRVAAIVVLAGALTNDTTACAPSEPVSVLQIHGTLDDTILYEGGTNVGDFSTTIEDGNPYPGAQATVARWVTVDECNATASEGDPLDLDIMIEGAETTVDQYSGCAAGTGVELWSIVGGSHIPVFSDFIGGRFMDWLLAHPK
jgi:polyhydroxybutyrate depolymerase